MDFVLESRSQTEFPSAVKGIPNSSLLVSKAKLLQASEYSDLVDEVRKMQQQRTRLVSIRRQRALRIGPEKFHSILEDSGLQVCTIGFAGGFTGSLNRGYKQAVDDTRRSLEYAARLKARAVVVVPGSRAMHTYNHAERVIRDGLNDCLDDALRYRIDMVIPLNAVFGHGRDIFHPNQSSVLDWIESMGSHRIKPMMMLRGSKPWKKLPDSWQRCLLSGGVLRASRRCYDTVGAQNITRHILSGLSDTSIPVS